MQPQQSLSGLMLYNQNWGWSLAFGILLIIGGSFALSLALFTTLLSVLLLGAFFLGCGIIIIVDAFAHWWKKSKGFYMHLLSGILYTILGGLLLMGPFKGAVAITFLLGAFFILAGIFRTLFSLSYRLPGWEWNLFSGVIALLLGILILAQWPSSGLYIIGLFIGIDLIFIGWSFVMMAFLSKKQNNKIKAS